jgi:hypothetical protein
MCLPQVRSILHEHWHFGMLLQGYLQGVSTFVSYFLTTTHDGLVEDLAEHQPRASNACFRNFEAGT